MIVCKTRVGLCRRNSLKTRQSKYSSALRLHRLRLMPQEPGNKHKIRAFQGGRKRWQWADNLSSPRCERVWVSCQRCWTDAWKADTAAYRKSRSHHIPCCSTKPAEREREREESRGKFVVSVYVKLSMSAVSSVKAEIMFIYLFQLNLSLNLAVISKSLGDTLDHTWTCAFDALNTFILSKSFRLDWFLSSFYLFFMNLVDISKLSVSKNSC